MHAVIVARREIDGAVASAEQRVDAPAALAEQSAERIAATLRLEQRVRVERAELAQRAVGGRDDGVGSTVDHSRAGPQVHA